MELVERPQLRWEEVREKKHRETLGEGKERERAREHESEREQDRVRERARESKRELESPGASMGKIKPVRKGGRVWVVGREGERRGK